MPAGRPSVTRYEEKGYPDQLGVVRVHLWPGSQRTPIIEVIIPPIGPICYRPYNLCQSRRLPMRHIFLPDQKAGLRYNTVASSMEYLSDERGSIPKVWTRRALGKGSRFPKEKRKGKALTTQTEAKDGDAVVRTKNKISVEFDPSDSSRAQSSLPTSMQDVDYFREELAS